MSDADPDFVAWLKGVPARLRATSWSRMESAWNAGVAHERARLLADAESREENARQFGQKEAREGAIKLAEEIIADHDTPGHCDCDVAEAFREFIRRLRESAP